MMRMKKMIVFAAFLAAIVLVYFKRRKCGIAKDIDMISTPPTTRLALPTARCLEPPASPGGALVTNGNNGGISGQWGGAGPMMTLDPSAVSGLTGAFTIESRVTCTTN